MTRKMTSIEFAIARRHLGWSVVDTAAEYDVTPEVIEAFESGSVRIPNAIARDIRFRSAVRRRQRVLEESGLPECPVAIDLRERAARQDDGRNPSATIDALRAHFRSCALCRQRFDYVDRKGPELPEPPAPLIDRIVRDAVTASDWLLDLMRPFDDEYDNGRRVGIFLAAAFSVVACAMALLGTTNRLSHLDSRWWRDITSLVLLAVPRYFVGFYLAGFVWDALQPVRPRFLSYALRGGLAAVTLYGAIGLLVTKYTSTLFLELVALLLLLVGPIIGFEAALRLVSTRWQVLVWSAAGGAAAALVLIGLLFLSNLISPESTTGPLHPTLGYVGWYALFGLAFAFAGMFASAEGRTRLVVTGLMLVCFLAVIRVGGSRLTHRQPGPHSIHGR